MTPRSSLARALLVLVCLLAACGDADGGTERSDSDPTTSEDASPSTSTTADTTTEPSTTRAPTAGSNTTGQDAPTTTTAARPPATAPPTTAEPTPLQQVAIALEPVRRFDVPTVYRAHPDGSGWIGERAGTVRSLTSGAVALDIRGDVRTDGTEQGLLGIAFDPDGSHLYVSYSDDDDGGAGVVDEFRFEGGVADPATRREIIRVAQPYRNHNGGDIHFGPDGFLWFGLGDGGSAGDPHENGQDPSTLLGSILRIDPSSSSAGRAYGIPSGNPFVDGGGRPEVWLYGVRNPWRFTFDPANGDLWVADVGQSAWEEVNVLRAADGRGRGANLGWNQLEGTHTYDGPPPPDHVLPVFEYSHDEGCSVTGGPVYRGARIPGLRGAYLFGDYCRTTVRAIRVEGSRTVDARTFPVDAGSVISFGVEPSGEVLVLAAEGTVHRIVPG